MIESIADLRKLYPGPKERALMKQLTRLDRHCQRFVELSPFVVIASGSREGNLDASPRGGDPGFVKAPNETTLLIPDAPGNNRLDTLNNIIETGRVGLLFLIPGVDETLRINGKALATDRQDLVQCFSSERRAPKIIIQVTVEEAFLHCAKAFMRSRLWSAASRLDRATLPTMGQMLGDQTGIQAPPETQEEMVARYTRDL
jgi:PPOX class probable FMN-dependent enzyme